MKRLSFIVSIFSFMFAVLKFAVAFSINLNCFTTRRENCYVIMSVIVKSYEATLLFQCLSQVHF